MMVTFVSQCEKKSLAKTRRVLDAFANRIGSNTWQTVRVPYANAMELILDICRYGPDVEVIEPERLRLCVAERLRLAAEQYD